LPILGAGSTIDAMDRIFETYKENGDLHHAYLIEGEVGASREALYEHLRTCNLPHAGHPDFWLGEFETLGIDESRELKAAQTGSPISGAHRIFVVTTTLITHEAQNALLKVFEEPTPGSHFFLLVPSVHALLPTLRSRMMHAEIGEGQGELSDEAQAFLSAGIKGRLDLAKKVADKKDRLVAITLADEIVQMLHARALTGETAAALAAASRVREYLNDRAPSTKMLFEYLALVLPQKKNLGG